MQILPFTLFVALAGCRTPAAIDLAAYRPETTSPPAEVCRGCHAESYSSWQETAHGDEHKMAVVPFEELQKCGACHTELSEHLASMGAVHPGGATAHSPEEQNVVCGKCHFNADVMPHRPIHPDNRHGLFLSVGFEDKNKILSCLDCHDGHSTRADMLHTIRAHTCFTCHKEAIVTMGVFQPLNYLGAGKVCLGCHPTHGGTMGRQALQMSTGVAVTCVACHIPGVQYPWGD